MTEQLPAVTDGEMARMYQVAAEERRVTIATLERQIACQRDDRRDDHRTYSAQLGQLLTRCDKAEARNWMLLNVVLLETAALVAACLRLFVYK